MRKKEVIYLIPYIACVRKRPTNSATNGRVVKTFSDTSIMGYVGSRSQGTAQTAGQDTIISRYNFYCDDLNLKFGDMIVYNNTTYRVTSNPQNTANKNHHIKAEITLINNVT